jgi:hypothetical protein
MEFELARHGRVDWCVGGAAGAELRAARPNE